MSFKKGNEWNGNRVGRTPGTGHRQRLFKTLVEPHKEALFDAAIKLALDGNESMLRLFLERLLPAKPTDDTITIDMPTLEVNKTSTLSAWGGIILQAVTHGEITPDEGKAVMTIGKPAHGINIMRTILPTPSDLMQ